MENNSEIIKQAVNVAEKKTEEFFKFKYKDKYYNKLFENKNNESIYTEEAQNIFENFYEDEFDRLYLLKSKQEEIDKMKENLIKEFKVRINYTDFIIAKATKGASGYDLKSTEDLQIEPFKSALVPTGIKLEIPEGYEAQVRSRSGLALKQQLFVLNSPGTIDSDYRGEVGVILYNGSQEVKEIKKGDRIAQLVFAKVEHPTIIITEEKLEPTKRDEGGFGSTGNK